MNDEKPTPKQRRTDWPLLVILALVVYVLSSGPVIALAFWLREATDWNGFYAVMWLYYPLLCWGNDNPLMRYIGWWFYLLGTKGPG